ncbi:MAG: glutamyl-tRNA reductase [Bacteroidetes bacterium]|nr:glutamyl-tRNA reductase [Bacteroidota bacterium]
MGILSGGGASSFIKKFYVVGVNFHKTDARLRSKFSVTSSDTERAYAQSSPCLEHYFILSTCNRTEIYGFAPCEYVMLSFLKSLSGTSHDEIKANTYIKVGDEAVKHLLVVASGLDSQIPGDYEVVGQIRNAFQFSKKSSRANGFIEKVVNQAILVSKTIKNSTAFSDGTVSVSYAVVQQIKKIIGLEGLRKICVVGLGKMGLGTLKYLQQHIPEAEIIIVNRNEDKLNQTATLRGVRAMPLTLLGEAINKSEIVIVATGGAQPVLFLNHILDTRVKYIFDLAMPRNVDAEVYAYQGVNVLDVDLISKSVNETIDKRLAEIPQVEAIVHTKAQEFFDWQQRRKKHTSAPAAYEQLPHHVISDFTNSHTRQHTCFMANQCCDGKPAEAWPRVQAYSA